jgi:SAM-dependent methyltransferase
MRSSAPVPVEQHDLEIKGNREVWSRKPVLQDAYRRLHGLIAARLDRSIPGLVVELGSGMGAIKGVIPDCLTTDLFPNPWLDRRENAYRLSFADGSVSNLILFDVWHHLRYPGTVLREFRRVLHPGGRVIILDPAISWLGRVAYGLFHHEPVALRLPLTWEAPEGFRPEDADYFAAQGMASRHFWWGEDAALFADWEIREVEPIIALEYFASGGFSGPTLGGRFVYDVCLKLNRLVAFCPRLFAARLVAVLVRRP